MWVWEATSYKTSTFKENKNKNTAPPKEGLEIPKEAHSILSLIQLGGGGHLKSFDLHHQIEDNG